MVLSLDAVDWQQRLAAGLATRLAPVSCVVVARTTAQPAEPVHDAAVRLEKVLDACATSPYARNAKRWVLAGERFIPHLLDTKLQKTSCSAGQRSCSEATH